VITRLVLRAALPALLAAPILAAENPFLGEPVFDLQKDFFKSQTRPGHWMATLTVAKDGSLLVFRDRREKGTIEVLRSEDGGVKWGEPVTVGDLVEIEGDTFDDERYNSWHHGRSIIGNVIVDESSGDIMVFTTSMKPAQLLYRSSDHGKTWHPSAPFPETGTGESGLVELTDGRIYFNSRTHTRPGNRRIAWSEDGGETWGKPYESKVLPDGPPDVYGCKAGLVRLPVEGRDILIYSSPKDHLAPKRDDIALRASFDGAKTWPAKRVVTGGPGGYTWLAAGRPGTPSEGQIYLLSHHNSLLRFNLSWLLDGKPVPKAGQSDAP